MNCPVCNQKYHLEPGFYFGAMYVAYGLGVGMFIGFFLLTYYLFDDPKPITYIIAITIPTLIFGPKFYKLSRIIWANIFIPYRKKSDSASQVSDS